MKIILPDASILKNAGKTIYTGYARAWEHHGHEVLAVNGAQALCSTYQESLRDGEKYKIMIDDFNLSSVLASSPGTTWELVLSIIEKSEKCYIFTQPTRFPDPWGTHVNFVSGFSRFNFLDGAGLDAIKTLNQMENVHLWNWVEQTPEIKDSFYKEWKDISYIPLAFDSISYKKDLWVSADRHDVCYVGGRANNGFNEKEKIMFSCWKPLMESGLNCGIFIDRNLSHEQENKLLDTSKVSLNIHDNYQRILGLDTNERTFKALGLTGVLVSDNIKAIENLFPEMPMYNTTDEMMSLIDRYLSNEKLLIETKKHYRNDIMENHTYIHRVKKLIDL